MVIQPKHYDSWAKSSTTPRVRPPKMPSGQRIRTQKWSNPLLCPVGGRWGMTLMGALRIHVRDRKSINFTKYSGVG